MNPQVDSDPPAPVQQLLEPPSLTARYTAASILIAIFAVWGKYCFVGEKNFDATRIHDYKVPLTLTVGYLVSLPVLRVFSEQYLSQNVDVKLLLRESMILYNAAQVLLNCWMVYTILQALVFRGHPFIGDLHNVSSGATYAVWIHYTDKYLEFLDTYFMVLRGKMDQVSFLHIYHHATIAWAWWAAMNLWPGGDAYFGALLNSWIHVMMYSYYTLSLLKIRCPWKKYLTQAQLMQFLTVLAYTAVSYYMLPRDANWRHVGAHAIQTAEMISLFVLFLHFYQRAYLKKKRDSQRQLEMADSDAASDSAAEQASLSSVSTEDVDDQCQATATASS